MTDHKLVSLDLETHLLQPGLSVPPIVCGSRATTLTDGEILTPAQVRQAWAEALAPEGADLIIGANIAYDCAVIAHHFPELVRPVFNAYDTDRVYDVQLGQALDAIAGGHLAQDPRTGGALYSPETGKRVDRYSLYTCVDLTLGRGDSKVHDFWRRRYAILESLPFHLWPLEARQYPVDDARNTLEVALVHLGMLGAPNAQRFHDFHMLPQITGSETFLDQFSPCTRCGSTDGQTTCPGTPERLNAKQFRNLHNAPDQARAAFALHLGSVWGLRTNAAKVEALAARVEILHDAAVKQFTGVYLRADGSEDQAALKRTIARAYGATGTCGVCAGTGRVPGASKKGKGCKVTLDVVAGTWIGCDGTGLDLATAPTLPRSEKGGISTNRDTLEESGDDQLEAYSGVSEAEKLRDTYLPFLRSGIETPINPRSNPLLETGRVSYDGVIQLIPRKGGLRECFEPRPGWVYCSTDYSAMELCTLAQVALWFCGHSHMADVINETGNPGMLHTAFGASMIGITVDEMKARIKAGDKEAANTRQAAKVANFSLGGGAGAPKLVLSNRARSKGETVTSDGLTYAGIRFCVLLGGALRCGVEKVTTWKRREIPPTCKECIIHAERLKAQWLEQWPEMVEYFRVVGYQVDTLGEIVQFGSDRMRGGVDFSQCANGYFQGLGADGAKRALWLITRECYTVPDSPLYGTRPVIFAHDEVFSEMPEHVAHLAGPRQAELMIQGLREFCPDVTIVCEPALMREWSKDAEPVYDNGDPRTGRLIPWERKR